MRATSGTDCRAFFWPSSPLRKMSWRDRKTAAMQSIACTGAPPFLALPTTGSGACRSQQSSSRLSSATDAWKSAECTISLSTPAYIGAYPMPPPAPPPPGGAVGGSLAPAPPPPRAAAFSTAFCAASSPAMYETRSEIGAPARACASTDSRRYATTFSASPRCPSVSTFASSPSATRTISITRPSTTAEAAERPTAAATVGKCTTAVLTSCSETVVDEPPARMRARAR